MQAEGSTDGSKLSPSCSTLALTSGVCVPAEGAEARAQQRSCLAARSSPTAVTTLTRQAAAQAPQRSETRLTLLSKILNSSLRLVNITCLQRSQTRLRRRRDPHRRKMMKRVAISYCHIDITRPTPDRSPTRVLCRGAALLGRLARSARASQVSQRLNTLEGHLRSDVLRMRSQAA